ncbi:MAG: PhoPQ-activated pathogenicity-related family protein [Acidobacteriota bacterium]|nr:PhoPQ-activated pathogenicity-related family protein [Acidobacteriota bacterium]
MSQSDEAQQVSWFSMHKLTQLALTALVGTASAVSGHAVETALDRYVQKPDAAYTWKLTRGFSGNYGGHPYTAYVLELTSQRWRPSYEVDRPLWKHWLTIIKPEVTTRNRALLYIGGGRNGGNAPDSVSERSARMAVETRSVVADLGQVPNQPLHFADSRRHGRSEDDLIAYSRVKYMVTGDEEWLARLPMVKSGVRAMDAVQEFLASEAGGRLRVDEFVVAGGSKRGWTTWLVGAVDERVIAIMPLVIDALNTEAVTRHHFAAYGFFSRSLGDYVRHGLYPHKLGTPEFDRILEIEDPYRYRDRERLKIPKFVVNATGDQYFLPDNSRFYFQDLQGEKHLRYVPNAKHNLAGSDARESMIAFYQSVLDDIPRPRLEWEIDAAGTIRVAAESEPTAVYLWQAHSDAGRDLRLDTIGAAWRSEPLEPSRKGAYEARVPTPDRGYTAFMIELVYESGGPYPFKFTTDVSVLPRRLPYSLDEAAGPWLQGWSDEAPD